MLNSRWGRLLACGAVTVVLGSVLSGCTVISDPKGLMKKPMLSTDKEKLFYVVQKEQPPESNLIRPKDMNNTSMIRVEDLDGDGTREAIVFYETPNENVRIHGMLLEEQGDTWVKKLTFDVPGSELQSFKVLDITNDGNPDIILGVSLQDQKALTAYSYNGGALEQVLGGVPYNQYIIDDLQGNTLDMNGDGKSDFAIVALNNSGFASVALYQYDEGSFKEVDRLQTDYTVKEIYNALGGEIAKDKMGIVLDTELDDRSSFSQLIYVKDNKLVNAFKSPDQTYRDDKILSGDFNNDGIIEFGLKETPKGWEHYVFDSRMWFYTFYQWDGKDGKEFVSFQYRDDANLFHLNLKPEWYGKITIDTKSEKEKYIRFKMIDTDETVGEIKYFTLSQWEQEKGKRWKEITRTNDRVIASRNAQDSNDGLLDNMSQLNRKGELNE
ncbi:MULTISPECIES: hypothetical protein [Paenibacillus]|uniref:VCBS repeat-containing protein n=1 Tax=Paenibacillus illinoisensis TaxID=59845 RepID=A0A2W0CAL0_9BACL|nr:MULTISPECIES: hypothetical protein [Paenibacillus]MBE7680624.1 hypothetical protein [Paenibacillus sp. P13VS]MBM6385541.1 hypothetical protein [Paenibacillus sp.]MBY0219782.1 hypothetical protein [Paenibacillus illinoisensis]MCM3203808.1 hypothetical protein [Paenibacillus illinoisensis]PYY25385.1 Uncharacterized protein PIL02S_06989 [Paenibacillus illinoisensis]